MRVGLAQLNTSDCASAGISAGISVSVRVRVRASASVESVLAQLKGLGTYGSGVAGFFGERGRPCLR